MHICYYLASILLPQHVLFIFSGIDVSSADTKFRIAFQILLFRLSEKPCLVRRAAVSAKMTGNRLLPYTFLQGQQKQFDELGKLVCSCNTFKRYLLLSASECPNCLVRRALF